MLSDSEEEFQSADEGSDCEDFESPQPVKDVLKLSEKHRSSPSPVTADFHDEEEADNYIGENHKNKTSSVQLDCSLKAHCISKSSTAAQVEVEQCGKEINENKSNNNDNEIVAAVSGMCIKDTENQTLTTENFSPGNEDTPVTISGCAEDAQKCNTSENDKSTVNNKEELQECAISNDADDIVIRDSDQGFSSEEESKENVSRQMEKRENDGDSSKGQEHSSETVFLGESGHEPENTKDGKDTWDHTEKVIQCEDIKAEVNVEHSQDVNEIQEIKEMEDIRNTNFSQETEEMSCSQKSKSDVEEEKGEKVVSRKTNSSTNSNSKPIRKSKIGMKKPRERLGERLGAKKLSSRIEKKTSESISSDSIIRSNEHSSETDKSIPKNALGMQKTDQEKKEDVTKQTEDKLKEQQWKEQQQRWQQIHNLESESEKISSEDDTGNGGWGGSWGGWGNTIFSAASTFTREVGRGVETVMETVEGSLGVPDPQTLAKEIAENEKELKSEERCLASKVVEENQKSAEGESSNNTRADMARSDGDENEDVKNVVDYGIGGLSSLGFLVSGVSGVLETASSKVLLGGLDTLEVIGRKAMNVIQEGDPGLRKKRAFLVNRKPNLSLVLQEARQRAEEEKKHQTEDHEKGSKDLHKPTFYQAWEATEGPVHIEALSLIARQCESKMTSMLQSLPHYLLDKCQAANAEIKNACKLDEETEFEGDLVEQVTNFVSKTGLPLHVEKINMAWSSVEDTASMIQEAGVVDGSVAELELFKALASLVVQLSAVIHKGGELALITPQADPLTVAVHFRELTNVVCGGIEDIADQVCETITTGASPADPQVNNTITNIYLQATSGNSYINESMVFLSSVLQYANTKQMAAEGS